MSDFVAEAIVLDVEDNNEQDARIFFFTKELGKVSAKAVSMRKITSKIAGHCVPLRVVQVRFIEKNALLATDALAIDALPAPDRAHAVRVLHLVKELFPDHEPDYELWEILRNHFHTEHGAGILRLAGFDPAHASCVGCGAESPRHFLIRSFEYFCDNCFQNNPIDEPSFSLYS